MADVETDALYASLRRRSGRDARSNGYLATSFFLREQRYLLSRVRLEAGDRVLDLACGSGLMLAPAVDLAEVVGVDFNAVAALQAAANSIEVVRGDAFSLPFAAQSFDAVCCCQFLNQQAPSQQGVLLAEAARVLRPGGRLHLMWRNGRSLLHRCAHTADTLVRRAIRQPVFPQYFHAPETLINKAVRVGLHAGEMKVTLPLGRDAVEYQSVIAGLVGASFYLELVRDES